MSNSPKDVLPIFSRPPYSLINMLWQIIIEMIFSLYKKCRGTEYSRTIYCTALAGQLSSATCPRFLCKNMRAVYWPVGGAASQYSVFIRQKMSLTGQNNGGQQYARGQRLQSFQRECDFCISPYSVAEEWPVGVIMMTRLARKSRGKTSRVW